MKQLVVMSGGFHPFHAGHMSLYTAAKKAFPGADVVVGATNIQTTRPFPFKVKQKLAQLSGVPTKDFVEVQRQFNAADPAIANRIKNPEDTVLIFVRSEKDQGQPPMPPAVDPETGQLPLAQRGPRKGQPVSDYLQYLDGNEDNLQPMTQHAYMTYLPTVEFGPGMTSATEIRTAWPTLNKKRKTAMVMSLYPKTQTDPKLADTVVKLLDAALGSAEDSLNEFAPGAGDEGGGEDPYKYPKPQRYRRSADYFGQFEADHFDREDFDDATGVFKGYWGRTPIAYFKFDNPAQTGGDDPGMGWYYEPKLDGSDNTTAAPAVDNADERKQQELDMIRAFLKSGNRPNPDSQIGRLMKKHGLAENFADGRNPQDKGDAKRHGINTKASVSSLRKTAKQGGRKGQLAHWLANMKAGRAKKEDIAEVIQPGIDTVSSVKKLWQYTSRNLIDLASMASFKQEHGNTPYVEERLANLLKTSDGKPVTIAFDAGGDLEFDNNVLYIPVLNMWKFRGMIQGSDFVKRVVGFLSDQQKVAEVARKKPTDPGLAAAKQFAQSHYPGLAADPESAFDKWVQRSLMHSSVDDKLQDQALKQMAAKITDLQSKIRQLRQSQGTADYMDEQRL